MSRWLVICLSVLALLPSCRSKNEADQPASGENSWRALSTAVEIFADQHAGQLLNLAQGDPTPAKPSYRHWIIIVPVETVSIPLLQGRSHELAKALTAADSSVSGQEEAKLDPTIAESDEAKFTLGSGPAFIQEYRSCGSGGVLLITSKAVVKAKGSGYYPIMNRAPVPDGKKALAFDVFIVKWH